MTAFNFRRKTAVMAVHSQNVTPFGVYSMVFFNRSSAPFVGIACDAEGYASALRANIDNLSAFLPPKPETCGERSTFLGAIEALTSASDSLPPRATIPFTLAGWCSGFLTLKSDANSPNFLDMEFNLEEPDGTGIAFTEAGIGLDSERGVIKHGYRVEVAVTDGVFGVPTITEIGGPFTVPPGDYIIAVRNYDVDHGFIGVNILMEGDFLDTFGPEALATIWPECGSTPQAVEEAVALKMVDFTTVLLCKRNKCCC